jgi:two-component sensor histidine kinase
MEGKMRDMQFPESDLREKGLALLLGELNHRIRNLLAMIDATVRQTHSTSVEDYRAQLTTRISDLYGLYRFGNPYGGVVELAELLEKATRPYCANGAQVMAAGPDLQLEPKLAFTLHLVFHELAANANKHGALSSPLGRLRVEWNIRHVAPGARKLAIVWSEHGGPEVKRSRRRGFGTRLIKRALEGYGAVRLDFNAAGLTCFVLIDLDRTETTVDSVPTP